MQTIDIFPLEITGVMVICVVAVAQRMCSFELQEDIFLVSLCGCVSIMTKCPVDKLVTLE